jgi:hypothetical protein
MYQPLVDMRKPIKNKKELCLGVSIIITFQILFMGIILFIENIIV